MIAWIDDSVRKMINALDQLGTTRDTLVVFTSDNGPFFNGGIERDGDLVRFVLDPHHRPAGPFRGWKTDIWEGGTHVPLVARWPGRIKANSTSGQLVCLTDMLATFAAIVDEELPPQAGEDSFNVLPILLGTNAGEPVRDSLITH